jgi:hypothetical protein
VSVTKAEDVKLPFGDGTNNTDVAKFTLTAGSLVGALPTGWYDQFVRIRPVGANMWFYITTASGAVVANPASDNAGALGATRGEYVANGELFHGKLPDAAPGTTLYIARIGDAVGDVYVSKASSTPGNNTDPLRA